MNLSTNGFVRERLAIALYSSCILCIVKLGWTMQDLDRALADIFAIRSQIAAGTAFRGYGPAAIAATGGLALICVVAQFVWLDDPNSQPLMFFAGWAAAAIVSAGIVWVEMQARSRRHHCGLADAMIHQAVEQFLPRGRSGRVAGRRIGQVCTRDAVDAPGLWQLLGRPRNIRIRAPALPRSVGASPAPGISVAGFMSLMLASGRPFVVALDDGRAVPE